jgi:hypothetical protein
MGRPRHASHDDAAPDETPLTQDGRLATDRTAFEKLGRSPTHARRGVGRDALLNTF